MTRYFNIDVTKNVLSSAIVAATLVFSTLSSGLASPVNVNTASQSELESIKGIGPAKARTIIAERSDGGYFQDANDLQRRVRGIGMRSVEKMVDNGLTIESPSSFREPNGRTKKEGGSSGRRNSRNQAGSRNQSEHTGASRRNQTFKSLGKLVAKIAT